MEIKYKLCIILNIYSLCPRKDSCQARSQNCEKSQLNSLYFVRPHGTWLPLDGFSGNLIFVIFRKSVEEIQVSLKSDKNKGYFTRRPMHINNDIGMNSSQNEKCFRQKM